MISCSYTNPRIPLLGNISTPAISRKYGERGREIGLVASLLLGDGSDSESNGAFT